MLHTNYLAYKYLAFRSGSELFRETVKETFLPISEQFILEVAFQQQKLAYMLPLKCTY